MSGLKPAFQTVSKDMKKKKTHHKFPSVKVIQLELTEEIDAVVDIKNYRYS